MFITVQSNTSIDAIIFFYPSQAYSTTTPASSLIAYPVTIKKAASAPIWDLSFTRLCFVGNTWCFDFYTTSDATNYCADITMDQNYAYPMGGCFLKMQYCLDIPRITRNHVNPGAGDLFLGHLPVTNEIINYIAANGAPTFEFEKVDELMVSQCFAYGVKTAFFLNDCYGTLVNCNADDAETGAHITITTDFKYVSLISFSTILSGGALASGRNGVVFDGTGGKLFCADLHGITSTPNADPAGANSLLKVSGSGTQRVSLYGARTVSYDGSWAKFIEQTNASAIIHYSDSDQQDVTTPSDPGHLPAAVLDSLALGADTLVDDVVAETPTKLVTITVDGVDYQVFAQLKAASAIFLDNFTGTNGTNLTSHTPDIGSAWTINTGGTEIQSNKASSPADSKVSVDMTAADGTLIAEMDSPVGNNDALIFRKVDASNYWRFQINGAGVTGFTAALLIDTTGGSDNVTSTSTTMGGGLHEWKVVMNGTSIEGFIDGVSVISTTSSVRQTATIHGFTSSNPGGTGGTTVDVCSLTA